MPAYQSGYVAFAPSPGPNVDPYDQLSTASTSVPPSPEASPNVERRPSSGRASKGREKEERWEYVAVANDGLGYLRWDGCANEHDSISRKKSGVRSGKLDRETREKARKIRKVGACWTCWIQKVPVCVPSRLQHDEERGNTNGFEQCSEGETCNRCQTMCEKRPSLSTHRLCWRSGFKDYEAAFFPGRTLSRLLCLSALS